MFERLARSWSLVKASASVLQADKELMLFPALSAVALLCVTAGFAVPMVLTLNPDSQAAGPLHFVVGFLFYLVSYFVIFFCNSALVGASLIRLRGGDPTLSDGFRIAFGKVGTIFGYALIAATVGMVLRAIQERAGLIGRIIVGLMGIAWSLASFLVVPVLVTEEVGPIDAVKRSTLLLKKTWGEQFVGNFSIGSISGLAIFGVFLVTIPLAIVVGSTGSIPLLVTVIALGVFSVMAISLISATLTGIYTAAVYRYAAEGEVGFGFSNEQVEGAFRPK